LEKSIDLLKKNREKKRKKPGTKKPKKQPFVGKTGQMHKTLWREDKKREELKIKRGSKGDLPKREMKSWTVTSSGGYEEGTFNLLKKK